MWVEIGLGCVPRKFGERSPFQNRPTAESMTEPAFPEHELRELIAAGGVCERCGGLHIPNIEAALLAPKGLPWCNCECSICGPFREAVHELMAQSGYQLGDDSDEHSQTG